MYRIRDAKHLYAAVSAQVFRASLRRRIGALFVFAPLVLAYSQPAQCQAPADSAGWVSTWLASPADGGADAKHLQNQTIREIVHTTLAGNQVRVRISNRFGQSALLVGAVHTALRREGASIVPASDHAVTFSGRASISVPAGAFVLSDPIPMQLPAQADLAVSIYLPHDAPEKTVHPLALQDSYMSAPGNFVATDTIQNATILQSWPFLAGIDVAAGKGAGTIVAFGDSITDGAQSTPNTNHRWPDVLAQRLSAETRRTKLGVVNAGISGNRVLFDSGGAGPSALERFDRDVLSQPGVRYVIVLEGINDIGAPGPFRPLSEAVTPADLIAGYRQLIERAHEKGVRIFGCTLTPMQGAVPYDNPVNEQKREAVNQWIRTSHAFDEVIDLDKAVRNPANPKQFLAPNPSPDHLHPSDAGYKTMGDAIRLSLFQ